MLLTDAGAVSRDVLRAAKAAAAKTYTSLNTVLSSSVVRRVRRARIDVAVTLHRLGFDERTVAELLGPRGGLAVEEAREVKP